MACRAEAWASELRSCCGSRGHGVAGPLSGNGRRLAEGAGNAPASARADPVFGTGAASLDLPAFRELAAQAGFAPAPSRVTTGWTTVIPLSTGAAGRSCTCLGPFRRRMPALARPRQRPKLVSAAGLAPGACARPTSSVPSRVRWLLRYALRCPGESRRAPGTCSVAGRDSATLFAESRRGLADPMGLAP